ncbi:unnamed protein product [Polarella glacialis]|uniref:Uncharacterized protein n=1 Tax=Polarella glacialis TaxID=89957 RepID=A0A813IF87_POLGL|nr:unnamed protein product [Polarella glacialis]
MLITIQTMRDVKTTGRGADDALNVPEAGAKGDSDGRSLLGPKSRPKSVRNLCPNPTSLYQENIGNCVVARITGFSAGSYTAIVVHRALTLFFFCTTRVLVE